MHVANNVDLTEILRYSDSISKFLTLIQRIISISHILPQFSVKISPSTKSKEKSLKMRSNWITF